MFDVSVPVLILIVVSAFLTGALHGAVGLAGGVAMAAILSQVFGIKVAVPVMTCALVLSHSSRAFMYRHETDWSVTGRVLLFGCPTIILGAFVFSMLRAQTVALVFALFLLSSFPIRYWADRRQLRTSPALLSGASSVWGMLAGNVIGPGFFLAPFLLGTGMNRLSFVGTLATVTLVMNIVKLSVFRVTELMNARLFVLGVLIGLMTIPGNWLGRAILKRMKDRDHRIIVDVLTVVMIVNFLYLALA